MSSQEKSVAVSLSSSILILGFYLVNMAPMYREGSLNSTKVFGLWGIVIVLTIIVNIVGNILTHIVFSIINENKTDEEESHIEDERDKLIELKGARIAYIVFSIGVFLSMLTLVLDKPPLVMFSLLVVSGIVAEIVGDVSRLYRYRRGF